MNTPRPIWAVLLFGLATLTAASAAPQTPPRTAPAPPRDSRSAAATGTAEIRGQVVAADSGRPLRRVQIRVTAPELPAGPPRTTSTDEDGRYELTDLPAGHYTVAANRGGFLPLRYGQRRAREQAKLVDLADRQVVEHVDLALPKASVISGRVTDEEGEPIAGVRILAMRPLYIAGRRQLVNASAANMVTDDAGEYRIGGLVPGTYIVAATSADKWTVGAGPAEQTMGSAPTYFPGTTNIADAKRVTVGLGQEAAATDFPLVPARAVTLSGTAFDTKGRPFPNVTVGVEVRSEAGSLFGSAGNVRVAPDGTFIIRDVAPGEYKLRAVRQDPEPEVAILPIVVDGIDLTGLSLIGSAGGTVSGRVVPDEGVAAMLPRVQITVAERVVGQQDPTMLGVFRGRYNPVVAAVGDGAFSVPNVFGPAPLSVTMPDGWTVAAVVHDGRDITDAPIELRNGERLSGIEIKITDRVTTISGTLTDAAGAQAADGTVVVFAAGPEKWFEGSRFVRAVRPDQRGRYLIKGLPPGEYLAIALDYVEDGAWNEPAYLESLRARAQKVTLDGSEPRTLSLKVAAP